jgi:hypothetical protein
VRLRLDTLRSVAGRRFRPVLLIAALALLGLAAPGTSAAATSSWRFEPSTYDFGTRLPAQGPATAAFKLKNTGETSLHPELVSLDDQSGSGFEFASNGCKATLAPGAECTIEITFDPPSGGRQEATLKVETSSPGVPAAVAQLRGSGGEPIVVIEPAAVAFDPVLIPFNGLAGWSLRTVTVRNVGSADLLIEGLGYEEAGASGTRTSFGVGEGAVGPGLCVRAVIAPGGSCSLNVSFTPRGPGTYGATMKLEDDAADSPQLIHLSGTAAEAPPPGPIPLPQGASLPRFTRKPPLRTKSRTATFVFSAAFSPGGFSCRLGKGQPMRPCTSPVHLQGLKPGLHLFAVLGVGTYGSPGRTLTYHWRILR